MQSVKQGAPKLTLLSVKGNVEEKGDWEEQAPGPAAVRARSASRSCTLRIKGNEDE